MNRNTFRNLMILVAVLLAGMALFCYYQGKGMQVKIDGQTSTLMSLQQELENVARLSAALTELDQMTIDEKTATQLNLLRHLNIEQNDFSFTVVSRQAQTLGETQLFARLVDIRTTIPYTKTLKLLDDLFNTKKLQIISIEMEPNIPLNGDVLAKITGYVYGLEKTTSSTEVVTP